MTRKDYALIARMISETRQAYLDVEIRERAVLDDVSKNLAFALVMENPRFDRARFLDACGVDL